MAAETKRSRVRGAGIASLAEVARHWQASPGKARQILCARGVQDTGLRKRPTYRWKDVWRIEGAPDVPEALWEEFREPLLTPTDLAGLMPDKGSRTIRRDLEASRWPVIELDARIRRVRARDVLLEAEIRLGTRAFRRTVSGPATPRET